MLISGGHGGLCDLSGLGLTHQLERVEPIINVLVGILEDGREEALGLLNGFLWRFVPGFTVPGEGIEPPTNGLQNRFQPLNDLNNSANCALFDTN